MDFLGVSAVAGFVIVALAARQIGEAFHRFRFPLISGFLFAGILAGPHVLKLIPVQALDRLRFVDQVSLAFIAFAAGNELFVRQFKSRFKSIRYVTVGLIAGTFLLGSLSFYLLCPFLPFVRSMPPVHRAAVSILAGAILVARSPSSAIAVVNELRARGPFTKTVLGVTMIMDVVVIALFAVNSSIAAVLITGQGFDLIFVLLLAVGLALSLGLGWLLGRGLQMVLARRIHRSVKTGMILSLGYGVFALSGALRQATGDLLGVDVLVEPMLICMVGSFVTTNHSHYRTELMKRLQDVAPAVYVAFFTLTGASLALDVLARAWPIALALFAVRLVGIFAGSFGGGWLAGEKKRHNKIAWMAYITQAGVGLGLAKEVAVEFPAWGAMFATIIIAVIILNQILGPPLFKWALHLAGEAQARPEDRAPDTVRDAVLFGLEGDAIALARLLQSHRWEVRIVGRHTPFARQAAAESDLEIQLVDELDVPTLNRLGIGQADAIVALLSDEENHRLCELAEEHFPACNLIVRLNDRSLLRRFREFGVVVVDPATAMVNLLDQFVRSPSAASLLLGMEQGREVIEFALRNADLHGIAIRDLSLPLDLHILTIRRQGQLVVTGGFTRLRVGDWLTVVGSRKSLEQMMLQFGEDREFAIVDMVDKATAREMASRGLKREVTAILHQRGEAQRDRLKGLFEGSDAMDLDGPMDREAFFERVAAALRAPLDLSEETLLALLGEREAESSTALRPDLAIPHIILPGEGRFHILLVRCREGIHFSELAPRVQAVFVLAGTRDQRTVHLQVLSAIAGIVQQPHFPEKWLRAGSAEALRRMVCIACR